MSNIKETYIDHKRECLKDLSFKGIPEAIAKEIASLVESAQITKDDIDDYFRAMVKNMWETCSHGQCVHFFKNLQHKDLSHVRSKSRYICSAMRAIINNSHQEMFTDLYPRDCRPQWTTRDRTRHPYRLHTDHQGDKEDRYRASDLERSRPYPSVSSFREHRGPADVECQERSQQRLGWHCNNVSFKHEVNCLTGNKAPEVDSGFVRINNSYPEERSMNSLASIPTSALRRMCHSVNNKLVLNEQQLSHKGLFVENVQSNQSLCAKQFQRFDNMSVVRQFPQGTVPQARCPGIVPSSKELQQVPQHIPLSLLVLPPPPPPPGSPVIPVTSGTISFP